MTLCPLMFPSLIMASQGVFMNSFGNPAVSSNVNRKFLKVIKVIYKNDMEIQTINDNKTITKCLLITKQLKFLL